MKSLTRAHLQVPFNSNPQTSQTPPPAAAVFPQHAVLRRGDPAASNAIAAAKTNPNFPDVSSRAAGTRARQTGSPNGREIGSERVKRPTKIQPNKSAASSVPPRAPIRMTQTNNN